MSEVAVRLPVRGDKVVIPKGAWLTGTHKSLPKRAGRTYTVTVHDFGIYKAEVCWVGSGSYWFYSSEWYFPEDGPSSPDEALDVRFGCKWVHCASHLRVHTTGWCTVPISQKTPLYAASDHEHAVSCAHSLGLRMTD